ncbi:anti-sigma-D factor RsdA [Micromonospora sp. NPDC050200]|uniref:anti-sigma-D factor RsdA n=1 Tax=Micromonospora sp. NPDC050200 TaxID=3155664 RepID=UPI0033D2B6F3
MTADLPPPSDPVLRDDRLLDALVRSEPPPPEHPADDPVTALLADWHTELVARAEQVESTMEQSRSGEGTGGPAAPPSAPPPARPAPVLRQRPAATAGPAAPGRPRGRRRTALAGAALSLITVVGGLWLGAARAEPGGLFWPVTELVNADRAESLVTQREVGRMLDEARQDLADHRYDDARHQLERAAVLLGTLGDDDIVTRLWGDIDELRRLLPPRAPTAPSRPGPDIGTRAVPVPSVTNTATSTVHEPPLTDPSSPHTPTRPAPTAPATAGQPTKPTGGASASRPSTPAADRQRQLPPAPTARRLGAKPHRDGVTVARRPATGPNSGRPTVPDRAVAGRTGPRHGIPDRAGRGQPTTMNLTGPEQRPDDQAADRPVGG